MRLKEEHDPLFGSGIPTRRSLQPRAHPASPPRKRRIDRYLTINKFELAITGLIVVEVYLRSRGGERRFSWRGRTIVVVFSIRGYSSEKKRCSWELANLQLHWSYFSRSAAA